MKDDNITRDYHRGEIYYANMNPAFGHEQGGIRPVLVLQNDVSNRFAPTLIVAQATRRIDKRPDLRTHVVLKDVEGLDTSLFMLEQIRTIDKRRIRRFVGQLTEEQMAEIDIALRASLHLIGEDFRPSMQRHPEGRTNRGNNFSGQNMHCRGRNRSGMVDREDIRIDSEFRQGRLREFCRPTMDTAQSVEDILWARLRDIE